MNINYEFEVSASVEQAWIVLGELDKLIPLLPGVRLAGSAGVEVFGTVDFGSGREFRGLARVAERDSSRHRLKFDIRGMQIPQPMEPIATVTVQLDKVGDRTNVTVAAHVAESAAPAVEDAWDDVMKRFAQSLATQLVTGNRPGAKPGLLGIGGDAVQKYAASGVVKLFLTVLGLATGRPYIPRGRVPFYGTRPKKPSDSS